MIKKNELTYSSLHVHSEFSNLRLRDSINRAESLLLNAHEKGLSGLCLTDHETLSGHPDILAAEEELKKDNKIPKDFSVMLGNEIYLVDELDKLRDSGRFYHFLLMAKSKKGHIGLRAMSNQAWDNMFTRGGMDRVPITKQQLRQAMIDTDSRGEIVASTACLGSEFSQKMLRMIAFELVQKHLEDRPTAEDLIESGESEVLINHFLGLLGDSLLESKLNSFFTSIRIGNKTEEEVEEEQRLKVEIMNDYLRALDMVDAIWLNTSYEQTKVGIHEFVIWCMETFGEDDFYIEIQPSFAPEQLLYNARAVEIAKAYGLKWIATTDAHFLNEEDIVFQEAFLNAQDGDREVASFYLSCYVKTPEEMYEHLKTSISSKDAKLAMKNTLEIEAKCESYSLEESVAVPHIDVPEDVDTSIIEQHGNEYEYIKKFSESDNPQDRYFLHLMQEGLEEKNEPYSEQNLSRIDYELGEMQQVGDIIGQNMAQYYVAAREYINIMWEEGDSLVGPARGSITGMLTAYLADIIQINPLHYDLPAWRLVIQPPYIVRYRAKTLLTCSLQGVLLAS